MNFKNFVKNELVSINQNLAEHMKRTQNIEDYVFSWRYRVLMYSSVAAAILGVFKAILALWH